MDLLKRSFPLAIRESDENTLSGYAFKFSETADGFLGKERFAKALSVEFATDCFLMRDHDPRRLLGRLGQNLSINTDSEGLKFNLEKLPDTELARETKTLVKSKILTGASVGFQPLDEKREDGVTVYTKIKLYEISLVPRPYFESSQVRENKTLKYKALPPELYL